MAGPVKKGRGRPLMNAPEPLSDDRDPWDRQKGEGIKAFEAFTAYRKLPAGERSCRAAAAQLRKYPSQFERWSSKWQWILRAGAWDEHVDMAERQASLDAAEKKARSQLQVAELMVNVSAKSLYLWDRVLNRAVSDAKANPDAPPAPSPISPADTQRLADTGLKLVQLLQGKPTDIVDQRAQITIEERRRGIQQLIKDPNLQSAMREVAKAMEKRSREPGVADESLH